MSAAPRLGRGLASLLGDPAREAAPRTSLPVAALQPGPFQPRTAVDEEQLRDLAESIRLQGVLQPILARPHPGAPGQYQIIAGERRWRASQLAGLHEIPALVRELSDGEAMAAGLVENLQRQDLNPIEEAEGYKRLLGEFGLSQEQLGGLVGKSRSHVANTLRLLTLPAAVQGDLQKGRLSAGHGRALLGHPKPETVSRMVIEKGLSVRQTEALANRLFPPPAPARRPVDPETAALERDLSARLGLRVQISTDDSGGSLRIAYRTLDQLDGVLARLMRD